MPDKPARPLRTITERTQAVGEPHEPVVVPVAHMEQRNDGYTKATAMRVPVYFRRQAREKVMQLEDVGAATPGARLGPIIMLLKDITLLSYYPWVGRQIEGLAERYRYLLSGHTYIVYCVIEAETADTETYILLLDIRSNVQKPLDKTTLKRYSTSTRRGQVEGQV